jgi:hypothetical protein
LGIDLARLGDFEAVVVNLGGIRILRDAATGYPLQLRYDCSAIAPCIGAEFVYFPWCTIPFPANSDPQNYSPKPPHLVRFRTCVVSVCATETPASGKFSDLRSSVYISKPETSTSALNWRPEFVIEQGVRSNFSPAAGIAGKNTGKSFDRAGIWTRSWIEQCRF